MRARELYPTFLPIDFLSGDSLSLSCGPWQQDSGLLEPFRVHVKTPYAAPRTFRARENLDHNGNFFLKVFLKLFSKLCTCRSKQQFFFLSSRRLELCPFLPARMIYGLGKRPRRQQQSPPKQYGPQGARSHEFSKASVLDQLGTRHSISVDFRFARTTIVILIIYIVIFYMSSNYR